MAQSNKSFGVDTIFLISILTFLGPIFFLRLGYCVGTLGFMGSLGVITISGLLAIPFSKVITEIASNQRSGTRGEYFMISRSFGLNMMAPIGIALYLMQLLCIAFLVIAFTESFSPLFDYLAAKGISFHRQYISIPCILILSRIMIKGALPVKTYILYILIILFLLSVVFLFLGHTGYNKENQINLLSLKYGNIQDSFFSVFSIFFSSYAGITLCLGYTDKLKNVSVALASITKAIIISMIVYAFAAIKMAISATPDELVNNQLMMGNIAFMGYIIMPIAIAFIMLPLALHSLTLAPKTLQALAIDKSLPFKRLNNSLSKGKGKTNRPYNAAMLTSLIVVFFVLQGELNIVAQSITILLLVCYGTLCLMSFLHHFTAEPSYRPSIYSKWYVPFTGFLFSLILLFAIKVYYALIALLLVIFLYHRAYKTNRTRRNFKSVLLSIVIQFSRNLQVFLQRKLSYKKLHQWRPSIICLSDNSLTNVKPYRMAEWISDKHGYGTYIHFIQNSFSQIVYDDARIELNRLVEQAGKKSKVYIDTLISPNFISALNTVVQYPGVSGIPNNLILFEYNRTRRENIQMIVDNIPLVQAAHLDLCLLASTNKDINYKKGIDVWIIGDQIEYSVLTMTLGSIIHDHPVWKSGRILFYILISKQQFEESSNKLKELLRKGLLPVTRDNLEIIAIENNIHVKDIICEKSANTGLSIINFNIDQIKHDRDILYGYEELGDILFVNASDLKEIG